MYLNTHFIPTNNDLIDLVYITKRYVMRCIEAFRGLKGLMYGYVIFLLQVSDKSEALAHQRLAARMLASKTRELERRLLDTADKTHI